MIPWRVGIAEIGVIPAVPRMTYFPDASPEALLEIPCYCFLVTDGTRHVLVDTGPDPIRAAEGGFRVVGGGSSAIARLLSTLGITVLDVEWIVHSHLHYDHVENDLLFPRAQVFVQRREIEAAQSSAMDRFYFGADKLLRELGDRLVAVEGELDVLPGITLVPNGGHTLGHQSVLVKTTDAVVCVCGDIVPMAANLEVICSATPDVQATLQFLDRAKRAGWPTLPAHDPALRSHPWFLGQETAP